jgi:tetratricopeptide (TPR) repeat protein
MARNQILVSVCTFACAAAMILGFAQPSSAAESDASPRPLCADRTDAKPGVLIGRFSVFGSGTLDGRLVDRIFAGAVIGGLGPVAKVEIWDPSSPEGRQHASAASLIDGAFLAGTGASRFQGGLVDFLRSQKCDYLVAGQISRDTRLLIATPLVLRASDGKIESLEPVAQSDPDLLNRAAEFLARRFAGYLEKEVASILGAGRMELGCLSLENIPRGLVKNVETRVTAIRREIAAELSRDIRLEGPVVVSDNQICTGADPATAAGVQAQALVGGLVSVRGTTGLAMRPVIRMVAPNARVPVQFPSTRVIFPIESDKGGAPSDVARTFVSEVKRLLSVVTTADGKWYAGEIDDVPSNSADLWTTINARNTEGREEAALLLAYRALARVPNDPTALLGAALGLIKKEQSNFGLTWLAQALGQKDALPANAQPALFENVGNAYASFDEDKQALEHLGQAKAGFEKLAMAGDIARVTRSLARIRMKTGDTEGAQKELLGQPDLASDPESLLDLGKAFVTSGEPDKGLDYIEKAVALGKGAKYGQQLGETYSQLAERSYFANELQKAIDLATKALNYRTSAKDLFIRADAAHQASRYKDAIRDYLSVLATPADKNSLKYIEASWLNLLESYLLDGDYDDVERLADRASKAALGSLPESEAVAGYLRLVAETLKAASAGNEPADFDKRLERLEKFPSKLKWDNGRIRSLLDGFTGPGRATVDRLAAASDKLFGRDQETKK